MKVQYIEIFKRETGENVLSLPFYQFLFMLYIYVYLCYIFIYVIYIYVMLYIYFSVSICIASIPIKSMIKILITSLVMIEQLIT